MWNTFIYLLLIVFLVQQNTEENPQKDTDISSVAPWGKCVSHLCTAASQLHLCCNVLLFCLSLKMAITDINWHQRSVDISLSLKNTHKIETVRRKYFITKLDVPLVKVDVLKRVMSGLSTCCCHCSASLAFNCTWDIDIDTEHRVNRKSSICLSSIWLRSTKKQATSHSAHDFNKIFFKSGVYGLNHWLYVFHKKCNDFKKAMLFREN